MNSIVVNYFDYDRMNLIPQKCIVKSRSECCPFVEFGPIKFRLPVVPANMECVINEEIALKLGKNSYFYIMHRFGIDIIEFCKTMKKENLYISISIGVNSEAYAIIDKLCVYNIFPEYITIDIAHGHSILMKNIITYIKENLPTTFIIAGNVCTQEAVKDLEDWGANCIKVGIGPGSACTTYNQTGFGSRGVQASIVELCSKGRKNSKTKIIADGGIKDCGDIVKSIVLGADMIMIGGLFSGLIDSPGSSILGDDKRLYKEFWGSASIYQNNKTNRIEGTKKLIIMKNHTFLEEMKNIEEGLQSAISYGGGNSLDCLKYVNYFIR